MSCRINASHCLYWAMAVLIQVGFFIHLLAVVLLVIDNAQSPCLSLLLLMLIQGVIIAAINSS
jgi:hypothetical protein